MMKPLTVVACFVLTTALVGCANSIQETELSDTEIVENDIAAESAE